MDTLEMFHHTRRQIAYSVSKLKQGYNFVILMPAPGLMIRPRISRPCPTMGGVINEARQRMRQRLRMHLSPCTLLLRVQLQLCLWDHLRRGIQLSTELTKHQAVEQEHVVVAIPQSTVISRCTSLSPHESARAPISLHTQL